MSEEVVQLVVKFARENPTWGYDRIQGALANLGHEISDTTVGNILRDHGIEPAPQRKTKTTWATFLKAHWPKPSARFNAASAWAACCATTIAPPLERRLGSALFHRNQSR